jgi:acyl-CoA synthetase (NDP forming)
LPPIVDAIRALQPRKPVLFAALDEGAPFDFPELEQLRALGVACFPSPERAMRALARVTSFALGGDSRDSNPVVNQELQNLRTGLLSEYESKQILAQIGIAIPQGRLASNADEGVRVAKEIGFPVVLKAQSADLPHKSDAGGVILGIHSESELLQGWTGLHRSVQNAHPGLALDGVLVERMGAKGLELIVGGRNDPQWGPVLLIGSGGVLAEAIKDVRLLPPDLTRAAIEQELNQLRCGALLRGFRGSPALDIGAVADVVLRVGRLMRSMPEITEIEINPLVVYENGSGAAALDALISVAEHT